jgi:hypothetical protein
MWFMGNNRLRFVRLFLEGIRRDVKKIKPVNIIDDLSPAL